MSQDMTAILNRIRLAEERLLHPVAGGCIEAARAHGVDLTLLIERLRKTPEEHVRDLQRAINDLEVMRCLARQPNSTDDAESNA